MDTGEALAISITIVFIFLGCIVSSAWYIKYKQNPIKRMATNMTKSEPIKLTQEELELFQINPIVEAEDNNLFLSAIKTIQLAVDKDSCHYYPEALKLYNTGIDQLMKYMKFLQNNTTRFELAKKIDIYIKRAKFLQTHINDKSQKLPLTPKPPIIK